MENGLNLENKTDLIFQLVNTGIKEIQNDLTKIKIKKYYQSYVFFQINLMRYNLHKINTSTWYV